MPNNTTAATVVGNKFVLEYYTALSQQPDSVATYYKAESSLTFSVGSFDVNVSSDAETEMLYGVSNIQKKIKSLNFHGCKVAVSSINCQESLNGGIVVVTLGTIAFSQQGHFQTPRPFVQTFFLGIQSEPLLSYYVLNDIFQFVNVPVNASSHQHAKTVIPANVPPTTSYTVASVPKQPETVHVAHNNVSSAPETHHSPIPAPQTTVLPVVHDKQHQHHADHHHNHQPANHATTAPKSESAPAKTENNTPQQSKGNNGKGRSQPRSESQRNPDEFKTVGAKKQQENRSPRTKRDNHQQQDGQQQQKPKNNNKNGGNSTRKDKKAENQTPESTEQHANNTHQPASNSWAKIARPSASEQAVVFAPPPIVYTAPPEEKKEEKKEKKEKKDEVKSDKPKQNKPKKDDPERAAWKKTRDLRSVRVGNLPFAATEQQVRDLFGQFGNVQEVTLKKGYGYVEFQTVTGVTNVLNHTKKAALFMESTNKDNKKMTRTLEVEQRKPRESAEPEKPFFKEEAQKLKAEAEKAQQQQQAQTVA